MQRTAKEFYDHLRQSMDSVRVTDRDAKTLDLFAGVDAAIQLILEQDRQRRRIMFIGNGASAAISSHMATDFTKAGGLRATAFNDASLLTCMGNDFGYEQVFQKPIEMLADEGDVLFAISSSGKSVNILNGVRAALEKPCKVITLSGFKDDNPLCTMGDLNFYVPSGDYGPVEVLHHSICHCILDMLCLQKKNV